MSIKEILDLLQEYEVIEELQSWGCKSFSIRRKERVSGGK